MMLNVEALADQPALLWAATCAGAFAGKSKYVKTVSHEREK